MSGTQGLQIAGGGNTVADVCEVAVLTLSKFFSPTVAKLLFELAKFTC